MHGVSCLSFSRKCPKTSRKYYFQKVLLIYLFKQFISVLYSVEEKFYEFGYSFRSLIHALTLINFLCLPCNFYMLFMLSIEYLVMKIGNTLFITCTIKYFKVQFYIYDLQFCSFKFCLSVFI